MLGSSLVVCAYILRSHSRLRCLARRMRSSLRSQQHPAVQRSGAGTFAPHLMDRRDVVARLWLCRSSTALPPTSAWLGCSGRRAGA